MNRSRSCTATKVLAALLLYWVAAWAWAGQLAGTVVNLSGPLLAKKADGTVKVLSVKSAVEQGDTLVTEKETYARIRFTDRSEITLKPGTQFRIDNFDFEEDQPAQDKAQFSLVKGGLRAVTGALGKRNKEKVGFATPTATIGIRGTVFIAEYVPPDSQALAAYLQASVAALGPGTMTDAGSLPAGLVQPLQLAQVNLPVSPPANPTVTPAGNPPTNPLTNPPPGPQSPPVLPPGLHVQVTEGAIVVTNNGGSQGFQAGQFGFVPSVNQPPVIVPPNPGLQFAPPPAFNSAGPTGGNNPPPKGNAVDCVVR